MPKQSNNYTRILESVVKQIEQSKLRAFSEVNKALLQAYWNIGKELSKTSGYGKSVVERLSRDLRMRFPGIRGYSIENLWNMKRFYGAYPKLQSVTTELPSSQKLQTVSGELLPTQKLQMPSAELTQKLQSVTKELDICRKLESLTPELLFLSLGQIM